jgi:ferredoxin
MSAIAIHPINRAVRFYEAPIGKKAVMAITGLMLFGYVAGHLLGNLQIYSADPQHIDRYAAFLHNPANAGALWAVRAVLVLAVAPLSEVGPNAPDVRHNVIAGFLIAAGGFISVATGSAPDGNAVLVPKDNAEHSMDAAACIGCGACVAMCPNASASLFMGAKIAHLGLLPQGQPERDPRVAAMVAQARQEMFGSCTNIGECEAVCPKEIKLEVIARRRVEARRQAKSPTPQARRRFHAQ